MTELLVEHHFLWPQSSMKASINFIPNKKVFLRERKRHTVRRVASARSAALSGRGGVPRSSPNGTTRAPSGPDWRGGGGVTGTDGQTGQMGYLHQSDRSIPITQMGDPCYPDGDTLNHQLDGGSPHSRLDEGYPPPPSQCWMGYLPPPRVWTDRNG